MTHTLAFITPAFLCGANQTRAELRAPSIRGEMRWWYRVLGAEADEEREVFGGVHGDPAASKVVVRVKQVTPLHEDLPGACLAPMSDLGYLYYFANASNKEKGNTRGPRVGRGAFFSPGTRFEIAIFERRALNPQCRARLTLAIQAFIRLGALGLRSTRGCGAMVALDAIQSRAEFAAWSRGLPHVSIGLTCDRVFPNWNTCQEELGRFLKQFRQDRHLSGKTDRSAVGFSDHRERESSALRLRPVSAPEGFLPVVYYTDRACSQTSQQSAFRASVVPL